MGRKTQGSGQKHRRDGVIRGYKMAIISTITCGKCGQGVDVAHSASECPPDICGECQKELDETKKRLYLNKLKELPLEERVKRIEEALYDAEESRSFYDTGNIPLG